MLNPFLIRLILLFSVISYLPVAFAHGNEIEAKHDHSDEKKPVHLTAKQAQSIDLKVVPVTPRATKDILSLNGEIQLFPNAQADISVRFSGQVIETYVNVGDTVKVGQRLAKIQSRQVGNPPPTVTVTALRDGVIDARNVNIGQAVEPNTVLFHIGDRTHMLMFANVYEEDLGKIKVGQTTEVKVLSYPDKIFIGKVIRIEPNLNAATRTVKVWITVDNPQDLLKPNLFALADVILREHKGALSLPNEAILEANNETFVFVRKGDEYERVVVKTGARNDKYTEIAEGLKAGQLVVTQGNRQVYTMWLTGGEIPGGHGHDH